MSEWQDKTDDEINIAVTCHMNDCYGWQLSESGKSFFHCGIDGNGYDSVDVEDFCKNPSVAWPIIVENKISIEFIDGFGWTAGAEYHSNIVHSCHDHPLRAAMIVYLEMNGVKP